MPTYEINIKDLSLDGLPRYLAERMFSERVGKVGVVIYKYFELR